MGTVLALLVLSAAPSEASPGAEKPRERAAFVLLGMKDHRDRLRSGRFRMNGRMKGSDPDLGVVESDVRVFSAFDFDSGSIRFDREIEFPEWLVTKQRLEAKTIATKHARTPNRSINWSSFSASRVKISAEDSIGKPFDVRIVGLATLGTLHANTPFTEIWSHLQATPIAEFDEEQDGLYRLAWIEDIVSRDATSKLKTTLWIDEGQGYSPIRLETRISPSREEPWSWGELVDVVEVNWQDISAVWVPQAFSSASGKTSEAYAVTWESVNGKIAGRVFTPEGLELPHSASVFDARLGKEVYLGTVGGDDARGRERAVLHENGISSREILVLANVLFLVAILVMLIWRSVRAKRPGSR